MSEDNLTVHILREIREEVRSVGQRLDQHISSTNQRFDSMDQRFDSMDRRFDRLEHTMRAEMAALRDHVDHQFLELELRAATRTNEQTAATRDLYDFLHANQQLRDRVERCEHDIADLKGRVR